MVSLDALLTAMQMQWQLYGNTGSSAMMDAWALLGETLNTRAEGGADRAAVFAGPLGMGKTTLAQLYAAMLPADAGALIVTRTIDQAKEFADAVNECGGKAFAYHSELDEATWNDTDALVQWPVVVACHRTYEAGLNMAAFELVDPRFAKLHAYQGGRQRALVIIDEAMPQILESRVTVHPLRELRAEVPKGVMLYNRDALRVLVGIEQLLLTDHDVSRPLTDTEMSSWVEVTTAEADEALARLGFGIQAFAFPKNQRATVRRLLRRLTLVRALMEDFRWQYVGRSGRAMVTTARMLVPPARSVTLDATGALSPVHVGRPDLFDIIVPKPTRTYTSVVARVARTKRGTGKEVMERFAGEIARGALGSLKEYYSDGISERRVLVVTHLVGEKAVAKVFAKGGFAEAHVAHWNKLDGSNAWRNADTIVLLSHPYRDPATDTNAVYAITGERAAPATLVEAAREIREARVAAANAQALGRTRMRQMLTDDGACPPVDVWIRVPATRNPVDADAVLAAVQRTLPGLQLATWELDETADTDDTRRTRGAKGDDALEAIAAGLAVGQRHELREGQDGLPTGGTFFRLVRAARTPGNPLQVRVARHGCRVEKGTTSKTNRVPPSIVRVQAGSLVEERAPRPRLGRGSRGTRRRSSSTS
jgi:hypothetical protein